MFSFCPCVLHIILFHLWAHAFAHSVTVAGRQPYRPRLVGGRRRGGPSSVALRSRNPPTGRRRDSPISSSLFSHGPPLSGRRLRTRQQSQSSPDPTGKDSATSSPILTEVGTSVRLSFQSRSLLVLADELSGVTVRMRMKLLC